MRRLAPEGKTYEKSLQVLWSFLFIKNVKNNIIGFLYIAHIRHSVTLNKALQHSVFSNFLEPIS